jgi:hypothetical protein
MNNSITFIGVDALKGLEDLVNLLLTGKNIASIEPGTFKHTKN